MKNNLSLPLLKAAMAENPLRYVGPVSDSEARDLINGLIDGENTKIEEILFRFLTGWIDPRGLAYEIQLALESEQERLERDREGA